MTNIYKSLMFNFIILLYIVCILSVKVAKSEDAFGLYGFYIGQSFEDAIKNAKNKNYHVGCLNLIQNFVDNKYDYDGIETEHYKNLCEPRTRPSPLTPLRQIISFSSELNNFNITEEDDLLIDYYVKQLASNYKYTKPKFFTLACYSSAAEPRIEAILYSKNGIPPYSVLSIYIEMIDPAISPLLLNKIREQYNNFELFYKGNEMTAYMSKQQNGGIMYMVNNKNFLEAVFFIGDFNVKDFLESLRQEIKNKMK